MKSKNAPFTLLDHTADLGIMVKTPGRRQLFEEAARAMLQIMVEGRSRKPPRVTEFHVKGEDLEDLMVNWLGEILYLFQGKKAVLKDVHIRSLSPKNLHATVKHVPFDAQAYDVLCEIKAVTYHQISVKKKEHNWEATIIFDV
jgi:SHS2 domain-containing protein